MPYKNDNLEELFQRAAKDYPLKTDNSNWDDLAAKLNDPATKTVTAKNRIWKYAAIVMLLAGSSVILYKFQFNSVSTKQQYQSTEQNNRKDHQKSSDPIKPSELSKTGHSGISVNNNKPAFTLKEFNSKNKQYSSGSVTNDYSIMNNNIETNNSAIQTDPAISSGQEINNLPENIKPGSYANNDLAANKDNNIAADNSQNLSTNNAADHKSSNASKQIIKLKPIFSRLYGTLYGGPQFSTVKFQRVEKPGYKIGVALGYRINRNFSAEIGLQREHLNFYSDGRYIDTALLRIKGNTSIESVSAASKLTSVPITLKYNFSSKGYGHFFIATGFNAVLITHSEKYKYSISKDGVEGNLSKNYSAVRSPKYFTGLNVSAGYETKLSDWCNIKFEPYYQAPINDFGVGRLPVSNFGIDIGIVKDLK